MDHKQVYVFTMKSLLDLDGYLMEAWEKTFEKHQIDIDRQKIQASLKLSREKRQALMEKHLDKPYLSYHFLKQYRDQFFFRKLQENEFELNEGVLDYLQKIKKADHQLVLLTAKPKEKVQKVLDYFSLPYYFDEMIFTKETHLSAASFIDFLKERERQAEETVSFVSSQEDMIASRDAGIDCIYLPSLDQNGFSFDQGIYITQSFLDLI